MHEKEHEFERHSFADDMVEEYVNIARQAAKHAKHMTIATVVLAVALILGIATNALF